MPEMWHCLPEMWYCFARKVALDKPIGTRNEAVSDIIIIIIIIIIMVMTQ